MDKPFIDLIEITEATVILVFENFRLGTDVFGNGCFVKTRLHCTVQWQLYIENQKHIPNFWIYGAFLIEKQLSNWRIVQNCCPFLEIQLK